MGWGRLQVALFCLILLNFVQIHKHKLSFALVSTDKSAKNLKGPRESDEQNEHRNQDED